MAIISHRAEKVKIMSLEFKNICLKTNTEQKNNNPPLVSQVDYLRVPYTFGFQFLYCGKNELYSSIKWTAKNFCFRGSLYFSLCKI